MKKLKESLLKSLLDIVEVVFISSSITILTFLFLAQPLEVTGESMLPTFQDKEQIIVEKVSIKYKPLERGEITVVRHPDNQQVFLIKRVIGLPGETIHFNEGDVFINGEILLEPYLNENTLTWGKTYIADGESITLNEDEYVMLGDNRDNSLDSRSYGPVSKENLVGRSFVVYYPIKNIRLAQ
ncbi:signal peptidase I [candidate division WWE3 bacterium]|nr:signal peptidase I [candidate division WWE3 bacterium]MBT7349404.1 signal peptidase I [candidate division WWE3 bacterium]